VASLFASGRIVDLILAFTAIEVAFFCVVRARTGRGVAPLELCVTLASGMFLMLALRCALVGAAWRWIALCLFASLVAHICDLYRRWR
jgi:hypothetical protein